MILYMYGLRIISEPGSPEQPLSAGHPAGHRVPRGPRSGGVPLPRGDACTQAVTGTFQTH
jgi:hypothetical protein